MTTASEEEAVSPDSIEHVRRSWEHFGAVDPLYAVLTDPRYPNGRWPVDEFFETGYEDVARVLGHAQRLGWEWREHQQRALDYGCGAGRLAEPLRCYFGGVVGMDIAYAMIAKARELQQPSTFPEVDYRHISEPLLTLPMLRVRQFEYIQSLITLQHNPPAIQLRLITLLAGLLKTGGLFVFDALGTPLDGVSEQYTPNTPAMQMHGLSPSLVIATVRKAGLTVRDVAYNRGQSEWSARWVSFRYFATREPDPRDAV